MNTITEVEQAFIDLLKEAEEALGAEELSIEVESFCDRSYEALCNPLAKKKQYTVRIRSGYIEQG